MELYARLFWPLPCSDHYSAATRSRFAPRVKTTRSISCAGSPTWRSRASWRDAESKDDAWWVIEAANEAIGATGIHGINWLHGNGTTGIVIGEKASWRKGYATEAMQLRTRYAFRELNLHKLMTEVDAENEASRKALERNGYRTVGVRREETFREGKWHERGLGEVLRADWEKTQA